MSNAGSKNRLWIAIITPLTAALLFGIQQVYVHYGFAEDGDEELEMEYLGAPLLKVDLVVTFFNAQNVAGR
jgi:hypothetical protein